MTDATTDVLIVGAGQAGLAMSEILRGRGVDHVVLERSDAVASSWRSVWDSLRLITPGWMNSLPGLPWPGPRDEFATPDDLVGYLETYARLGAPVQLATEVAAVVPRGDGGFDVQTSQGSWRAAQVVAATGPFQRPRIPETARQLREDVVQIHSATYRKPDNLPEGPTLVVGSGNSGVQIAFELAQTRPVTLAAGDNLRLPRRATGAQFAPIAQGMFRRKVHPDDLEIELDTMEWLARFGFYEVTIDSRFGSVAHRTPSDPFIGWFDGPRADFGVEVVGRVADADEAGVTLADGARVTPVAIVWATGYVPAFDWLPPTVLDDHGFPRQRNGVTVMPGLYVLGLRWMRTPASGILYGVGADAVVVAQAIQRFATGGADAVGIPTDVPAKRVVVGWAEMLQGATPR